jgi:hypothetical protein
VHGSFATTSPNFGSLQLPNGLLQRAHFLVSHNIALQLQYSPGTVIQRLGGGEFGGKTAFCQRTAILLQGK